MLSRKRNYIIPGLSIDGVAIKFSRSIRYLGMVLDLHLTFTKHMKRASAKALVPTKALSRLMPNVGGPFRKKRTLLMSVVNSIMFYAAPT